MLQIINMSVDRGRLGDDVRSRITGEARPLFSWGARSAHQDAVQSECRVVVDGLWDSGWVKTASQELRYAGKRLPEGVRIPFTVTIRDNFGEESSVLTSHFYYGGVEWKAPWIGLAEDANENVRYFSRSFEIEKPVKDACLYACGIGYSNYYINGKCVDDAELDPAFVEWKETCQYVMFPELQSFFGVGENRLEAIVGCGWRDAPGAMNIGSPGNEPFRYFGAKMLTAMLRLTYEDGMTQWIYTDTAWHAGEGPLQVASLFDGVLYNASKTTNYSCDVEILEGPGGTLKPMLIPPVREFKARAPIAVWQKGSDIVMDFGQNLAGVLRVNLPARLTAGQKIVLTHSEELDENGDLYTLTLRSAKAMDTYIASGDDMDLEVWQPRMTYHGFRYARIEGLDASFDAMSHVKAIELHTTLDTHSTFRCGNALVTKIHEMCIETERSNMHSILTDCPQRNERMGWMNDATVRFEATPYSFDIGRMFPKVIRDLIDEQGEDGSITCTAPFAYGARPADPVCSSFLVAGLESVLHTGNMDIIAEAYDKFAAWENCLINNSTDYIVNYSYYGDWAGPLYACVYYDNDTPGACSNVTPGVFMSSGFSFMNCKLLSHFAAWLGRDEDARHYTELAGKIRAAILKKWYEPSTAVMATGSQACQAFSLFLGLIPKDDAMKAAKVLHDDLVKRDYQFTTGNLCTRYMMDILTEYGYTDDAWRLLTKETYPSFGYMLQQEATTIWERFELMKNAHMNSHNHPMYGAVDYYLYAYIAGVKPTAPAWEHFTVKPYLPKELMSAQAVIDTVKGDINVRWMRRYDAVHLHVTVPFGTRATVCFGGETREVGSGFHSFTYKE